MNVRVFLSTVALVAVVGGSVFSYNQIYADKNNPIEAAETLTTDDTATANNAEVLENLEQDSIVTIEEIKAPTIEGSPFHSVDLEIADVKIPLDLADNLQQKVYSSNGNEILELAEVRGLNDGHTSGIIAFYLLADGKHEVIISQVENALSGRKAAVEEITTLYDAHTVKVEEHEGYTLVIEDAELRKQVHVISESHFFTVASPGTRDLELLLDVARKIKVS